MVTSNFNERGWTPNWGSPVIIILIKGWYTRHEAFSYSDVETEDTKRGLHSDLMDTKETRSQSKVNIGSPSSIGYFWIKAQTASDSKAAEGGKIPNDVVYFYTLRILCTNTTFQTFIEEESKANIKRNSRNAKLLQQTAEADYKSDKSTWTPGNANCGFADICGSADFFSEWSSFLSRHSLHVGGVKKIRRRCSFQGDENKQSKASNRRLPANTFWWNIWFDNLRLGRLKSFFTNK